MPLRKTSSEIKEIKLKIIIAAENFLTKDKMDNNIIAQTIVKYGLNVYNSLGNAFQLETDP